MELSGSTCWPVWLTRCEDRFYGSPEWRLGPREAVLACIVVYTDAVLEVPEEVVEGLRRSLAP